MNVWIVLALGVMGGIGISEFAREYLAKKPTATKSEVAGWAIELRSALAADVTAVRGKIETLAAKLESKL